MADFLGGFITFVSGLLPFALGAGKSSSAKEILDDMDACRQLDSRLKTTSKSDPDYMLTLKANRMAKALLKRRLAVGLTPMQKNSCEVACDFSLYMLMVCAMFTWFAWPLSKSSLAMLCMFVLMCLGAFMTICILIACIRSLVLHKASGIVLTRAGFARCTNGASDTSVSVLKLLGVIIGSLILNFIRCLVGLAFASTGTVLFFATVLGNFSPSLCARLPYFSYLAMLSPVISVIIFLLSTVLIRTLAMGQGGGVRRAAALMDELALCSVDDFTICAGSQEVKPSDVWKIVAKSKAKWRYRKSCTMKRIRNGRVAAYDISRGRTSLWSFTKKGETGFYVKITRFPDKKGAEAVKNDLVGVLVMNHHRRMPDPAEYEKDFGFLVCLYPEANSSFSKLKPEQ